MKKYCVQNDGPCGTCSLLSYGRDCRNNPVIACKACGVDMRPEDWFTDIFGEPNITGDTCYICRNKGEDKMKIEKCTDCGLDVEYDYIIDVEDGKLCPSCYEEYICSLCGEKYENCKCDE